MAKANTVEIHGFISTDARGKNPSKFLDNSKAEAEINVAKEVSRGRVCGKVQLINFDLPIIATPDAK